MSHFAVLVFHSIDCDPESFMWQYSYESEENQTFVVEFTKEDAHNEFEQFKKGKQNKEGNYTFNDTNVKLN